MPVAIGLGAGAVAAPIVGGVMANQQSKKAQAAFQAASAQAVAALEAVGIPSIEAQQILLQSPQLVGQLVPEMQQYITQEDTGMKDISLSPEYHQAQMGALDKLINMGDTPFTTQEQIEQSKLRRQTQGVAEQDRAATLQNAAQRGMAGSGLEFAMSQAAQQQDQQGLANASEAKMAEAQQRVLQSIMDAGNMGTSLGNQEFAQKSDQAKAQDLINQFNTANKVNVQGTNTAAQNNAQQYNLAQKQGLENTRAATANQQEQYNKQLIQQNYENRLAKAQGIANARMGVAGTTYQGGLKQAANTQGMGNAVGGALGAGAGYAASDSGQKMFSGLFGGNNSQQAAEGTEMQKKRDA